ncbi:MAG: ATP synthase F1 subunit epsilon [Coriobacteriia bacterium]|nr:ATP synthase F1 subunit epsilon [Coriobacteriia bacterium]MCL2537050.1 ATP synthase F1 subunit epsilon [Coriobacteriia bacterium]
MPRTLKVEIVTPDAKVFEGEVRSIVITAPDGEVGILPMHAPIIAEMGEGILRFKRVEDDIVDTFYAEGGYLQVAEDNAIVLTDSARRIDKYYQD